MVETCNYYDVLNCEENDKDETDCEMEDNSVYTGDEHYDYYNNERYYTEFYNGDGNKDETAMAVQQVSFKDIDKQTWLGDTGASAHMTTSLVSMKNLCKNNTKVTVESGERLIVPKIGDKVGYITRIDGTEQKVILKDTKYVSDINVNLMSLTTVMNQGYELIGKKGSMSIRKDGNKYKFQKIIKSGEGMLYGIQIQTQPESQITKKMSYTAMHNALGHAKEDITRKTAKYLGYELTGKIIKCESCEF